MTGLHSLPSCDDSAETGYVLAAHFLDECRRLEGRIEALSEMSSTFGALVCDVDVERPLPVDVALCLALRSMREAAAESRRFMRTQIIGLRAARSAFTEYAL